MVYTKPRSINTVPILRSVFVLNLNSFSVRYAFLLNVEHFNDAYSECILIFTFVSPHNSSQIQSPRPLQTLCPFSSSRLWVWEGMTEDFIAVWVLHAMWIFQGVTLSRLTSKCKENAGQACSSWGSRHQTVALWNNGRITWIHWVRTESLFPRMP